MAKYKDGTKRRDAYPGLCKGAVNDIPPNRNDLAEAGSLMFSRKWTREDDLKLLDMKIAGKPLEQITRALDRSASAVSRRLHVLLTQGVRDAPAPNERRACLDCGRDFDSDGIGNRICDLCKKVHARNGCFAESTSINRPTRKGTAE